MTQPGKASAAGQKHKLLHKPLSTAAHKQQELPPLLSPARPGSQRSGKQRQLRSPLAGESNEDRENGTAGEGHHCPHQHPRHLALLRGHPPSITPFSRLDFSSGALSGFTSPSPPPLFILLRSTAAALVRNAIIPCNLLAAASVVFLTPFLIISPKSVLKLCLSLTPD